MKNLQEEPVGENIVQLMFEHLSLIWFQTGHASSSFVKWLEVSSDGKRRS